MKSGQQQNKTKQNVKSGIQSQNQQPDRDTTQTQTQTQNIQSDQWDQQECQRLVQRVASLEIQYNEMKEQVDDIELKQWGMEEKCKEQLLYFMEDFYKQKLQSHIKSLITQQISQMQHPILAKVSNQQCQVEQNNTSPNTNPKQYKQGLQQVQGISQGKNELDQYDQFEIIDQNQNSESMKIHDHLQYLKEVQGNVEVVNKEYINEQIKEITKSLQEKIDSLKSQSIDITQKQCNEKDDRYNSVLMQLEEQKSLIVNIQVEIQEKCRLQQQNLQSQQLQVDDQYNRIQQQLDNQQEGLNQIQEIQYQLQATLKHNDDKLNKVEELYDKFNTLNQEALSQGDKAVTKIELSNGLEKLKEHINQSHQEKYNQLLQEIVNLQDTTNKSIQAGSKLHQLAFDNLNQKIIVIQDEMSKTITISENKQNLQNEQMQQQIKKCINSLQVPTEQLSEDNLNKLQQQLSVQLTCQKQITDQMQQKIERHSIELLRVSKQIEEQAETVNKFYTKLRDIKLDMSQLVSIIIEPHSQQNQSNFRPLSFVSVDSNKQKIYPSSILAIVNEHSQQFIGSEIIELPNQQIWVQKQKVSSLINRLYDLSCRKRVIPEEFKAFVGCKQDFSGLLIEYDATGEFQQQLGSTLLDGFRRIRGDGNCFYTSFIFSYLLLILTNQDYQMFDKFINNVKTMSFELTYEEGFIIPQADESYLKVEFMERLQILRNSDNKERDLEKAFSTDQDIFYGLAIIYLRNLVYQFYQQDQHAQELYQSAIIDNFHQDVITWESQCDQNEIVIELLARHLGLEIIVYNNQNQNYQKKEYGVKGNNKILLLFQVGHYQIGIEKINREGNDI